MDQDTLAEVICNLNGWDPNDEYFWGEGLKLARADLADAVEGLIKPWWEDEGAEV